MTELGDTLAILFQTSYIHKQNSLVRKKSISSIFGENVTQL